MSPLLLLLVAGLVSNTHSVTWGTGAETTVRDLHREYGNIFKNGNRNAASHHWSTFLLSRAENFDTTKLDELFSGYCAVSGSPVNPSQFNRYGLTLRAVTGEHMQGYMHYCCWPCLCDTQDFIKVDTHTVTASDGIAHTQHFAVIGNPCTNQTAMSATFKTFGRETTLATSAPDVVCTDDGRLEGATMSDHGYVIISRFFAATVVANSTALAATTNAGNSVAPGTMMTNEAGIQFQDSVGYDGFCTERANNGYNSGMGAIFRVAAAISPVRIAITEGDSSNNDATTVTTTAGEADSTADTTSGADSGSGGDSATEEVTTKSPNPASEDSETVSSDLSNAEENRPASVGSKQSSCSCFNYAVIVFAAMMMVFQY